HLVCHRRPRRRHPHGCQVDRDPVRRHGPGRAGRAVRMHVHGAGPGRPPGRLGPAVLVGPGRGGAAGRLAVLHRPAPRPRRLLPRVPAQPLGRRGGVRGPGAGVVGRLNMLERLALRSAAFAERWFPDAWVFAVLGVLAVAACALGFGASPRDPMHAFGGSFWSLLPCTWQMACVLIGCYVVATAPVIARLIARIARRPPSGRGAIAFVALARMLSSLLSWGFSLVFAGLLVR